MVKDLWNTVRQKIQDVTEKIGIKCNYCSWEVFSPKVEHTAVDNYGSKIIRNGRKKPRGVRKNKLCTEVVLVIHRKSGRALSFRILIRRRIRTAREHSLESLIIPLLPHPVHLLRPSRHLQLLPTNKSG